MNESVRSWFHYHTDFLYTLIYENGLFYIDFWTLVHLWSGIVLFTLLAAFDVKRIWFWLVFIIAVYEMIEVLFIYFALHIFRPEHFNDQVLDIIAGIGVAFVLYYILTYKSAMGKIACLPEWVFKIFSSLTFSFLWVGNYHYKYNIEILNTQGLNIWAFSLWLIGGYIFLNLYLYIKSRCHSFIIRITITWLVYFILLLIFEYVGYYLLEIREDSLNEKNALIFGLIHGTLFMHIYYVLFPFFIIPFYEILVKQTTKAQQNLAKIRNDQPIPICALNET